MVNCYTVCRKVALDSLEQAVGDVPPTATINASRRDAVQTLRLIADAIEVSAPDY